MLNLAVSSDWHKYIFSEIFFSVFGNKKRIKTRKLLDFGNELMMNLSIVDKPDLKVLFEKVITWPIVALFQHPKKKIICQASLAGRLSRQTVLKGEFV